MEEIKVMMDKIDALTIRERGIILAAILFVLYTVWDTFLMQPQAAIEQQILADLQINRAKQAALNIQYQELIKQIQEDPDEVNRNRLASLKSQLESIEADVRESTNFLVSPENMIGILRTILNKSSELELIEIKGLGASPLLTSVNEQATEADTNNASSGPTVETAGGLENAYKHGLMITFEGDYMSTLRFIQEIESLEWGFFWDNLDYEVVEYPTGRVVITLYTLSLDKNWIGV